jgi:uncharacterized protein YodC (DUF2158 family)
MKFNVGDIVVQQSTTQPRMTVVRCYRSPSGQFMCMCTYSDSNGSHHERLSEDQLVLAS